MTAQTRVHMMADEGGSERNTGDVEKSAQARPHCTATAPYMHIVHNKYAAGMTMC